MEHIQNSNPLFKEGVGKATDNAKLQAEGKAQKAKGSAQDVADTVKGKLGDDI